MKLYYSATSPFVRKCLVCAHELGLRESIELLPAAPHPVNRDRTLVACNPLGKAPALVTPEGSVLYDSRVICEFLNAQGDGHLLPSNGTARWAALVDQSLADGLMDAAVLTRYETAVRPESLRWTEWVCGQLENVSCALDEFERSAGRLHARVDLGSIALGCALGYLDFRYEPLEWRRQHPQLARWYDVFGERDSMKATRPPPG